MKPDIWMALYVNDYLGDTMHLTTEQHGAYMLLLMAAWKRGGPLPDDDGQLAGIARMAPSAWKKIAPVIRAFFRADAGQLVQARVERELEKARRNVEARRQNGAKGGRPRKLRETETKPVAFSPVRKTPQIQNLEKTPSPSPLPTGVSEDKSSDAGGVVIDAGKECWRLGKVLLQERDGLKAAQAGAFFGKLLSDHGIQARDLFPAVAAASANGTESARAYLTKAAAGVAQRRDGARLTSAEKALRSNIQ